jgi:hypothetical protein
VQDFSIGLKVGQDILSPQDRKRLVRKILERDLGHLKDDPLCSQIMEVLYASAVVRRFDRPLLSSLLRQPVLPDILFDRVTALSMVIERQQVNEANKFVLHNALRTALLADAKEKGLEESLKLYRRRALAFYQAQHIKLKPEAAVGELALDILFLHSNIVIRDVFNLQLAPLVTGSAVFGELDGSLESLMQKTLLYQEIGLDGEPLEKLINETQNWLALDWELHGETLRYFQIVRRSDTAHLSGRDQDSNHLKQAHGDVAGFALNVPVTSATLPLLCQDTLGQLYQANVGSISSLLAPSHPGGQCVFLLRVVVNDWYYSAVIRSCFALLERQAFDTLIMVIPRTSTWALISMLAQALGFDVLVDNIKYAGARYTALRLDVSQYGGPIKWLLHLVHTDLGIEKPKLPWNKFVQALRQALKNLWLDVEALSSNPLVDALWLAPQEAPDFVVRAEALITAIRETADKLRISDANVLPPGSCSHYTILDALYGLSDKAQTKFIKSSARSSHQQIARHLGIGYPQPFSRLHQQALEALARHLRLRK